MRWCRSQWEEKAWPKGSLMVTGVGKNYVGMRFWAKIGRFWNSFLGSEETLGTLGLQDVAGRSGMQAVGNALGQGDCRSPPPPAHDKWWHHPGNHLGNQAPLGCFRLRWPLPVGELQVRRKLQKAGPWRGNLVWCCMKDSHDPISASQ